MDEWTGPKLWHHPKVLPEAPPLTPVWVRLDVIFARDPGSRTQAITAGLDVNCQVRGLLSRWHRTVAGDWLGVVTWRVPYADGRRHGLLVQDQLVPAGALRRRDDNKPI